MYVDVSDFLRGGFEYRILCSTPASLPLYVISLIFLMVVVLLSVFDE